MGKNTDRGLTATHIYGTGGLIAGFVGLTLAIKGTSGIYEWLLFASGWLVSAFLTWFLIKSSGRLTDIIEKHDAELQDTFARHVKESLDANSRIVGLESTVTDLQKEIDRRHATLDYLSSILMTQTALPRQMRHVNQEDGKEE